MKSTWLPNFAKIVGNLSIYFENHFLVCMFCSHSLKMFYFLFSKDFIWFTKEGKSLNVIGKNEKAYGNCIFIVIENFEKCDPNS